MKNSEPNFFDKVARGIAPVALVLGANACLPQSKPQEAWLQADVKILYCATEEAVKKCLDNANQMPILQCRKEVVRCAPLMDKCAGYTVPALVLEDRCDKQPDKLSGDLPKM